MDLSEKLQRLKPAHIGGEEWQLRLELAACYRLFDWMGWTELIYNHITLRVPGPERHYLINPYGLWYTEITASNERIGQVRLHSRRCVVRQVHVRGTVVAASARMCRIVDCDRDCEPY